MLTIPINRLQRRSKEGTRLRHDRFRCSLQYAFLLPDQVETVFPSLQYSGRLHVQD